MLKTAIFRKILDGDLRKIGEMSQKIDQHEVLREKHMRTLQNSEKIARISRRYFIKPVDIFEPLICLEDKLM